MNINDQTRFNQLYQAYLNELTLQGKSPKTHATDIVYLRSNGMRLGTGRAHADSR